MSRLATNVQHKRINAIGQRNLAAARTRFTFRQLSLTIRPPYPYVQVDSLGHALPRHPHRIHRHFGRSQFKRAVIRLMSQQERNPFTE